ncbi:hypothetical protein PBAC_17040 [Pedobacter glucosidilyticus]|nr:hypothetical protein [Pedobacter glucosidilyticus]KHJ38163.1 hypothetical protein PBAC_17040 [Pedobacter glucosidilyticus]
MNKYQILALKSLRKVYSKLFKDAVFTNPSCIQDPDVASKLIYDVLMDDKPCMIARFGSTELTCLANYLGVHQEKQQYLNYIKGKSNPWWWEGKIIAQMQNWSGFFPPTVDKIEDFCKLMLQDIEEVDILGSWLENESLFKKELEKAQIINFSFLDPYWVKYPWTKALEGKKVLVIHPFAKTIESQYKNREFLFKDNILPQFDLITIKAVQSIAGAKTDFSDWFSALQFMQHEIDKVDFDVCLIGAGAYGLPLAAYVKKKGKIGFQYGGKLQLLFGIRGKRWENEKYNDKYNFSELMNDYWVRPSEDETPPKSHIVEENCYW